MRSIGFKALGAALAYFAAMPAPVSFAQQAAPQTPAASAPSAAEPAAAASSPVPPAQASASAPAPGASDAAAAQPAASAPAAAPAPIDFSKYLRNEEVGYAALAVEKAGVQKMLADEHYLRDDRQRADASYKATIATLDTQAPDDRLTDTQRSVKKLLRVDVEYRLLNLRLGNDFWSGYRTSKPSTPHRHMLVLESLMRDLERQADEMEALIRRLEDDAGEMARVEGMRRDLEGKIQDQALAQERAVIAGRQQRVQLGTWDERVHNLTSQRLAVEAQSKQLGEEQKKLAASASSMLTQAVAAGAGIPSGAVEAVVQGDVKAGLLQYAAGQLGDPNSSLSKAVGEVSSNAQKLQDLWVTAGKNYEELKKTSESLKQAADFVRKPTFEGLAAAGANLWAQLPEAKQKQLTRDVLVSAPAAGIMESYRRIEMSAQDAIALRRRLETLALQRLAMPDMRADLLTMAREVVKSEQQAREKFKALYKGISEINLTDEQFRKYAEHFARVGAADLFAAFPADQRQAVAEAMGEPNVKSAIERLANRGISALPQGRISNDRIVVVAGGKRSDIPIKALFANAKLEGASSGFKDLPALYEDMTRTQPLYRLALAQLPSDMLGVAVETSLRKVAGAKERRDLIDEIAAGISPEATARARQTLVESALGSTIVEDLVKRPEAAPRLALPLAYPASGGSSTGLSPEASAAATAALNYAIPGAGVAVSLAQSFAKMEANIDEMNRLADQSLRIMAEQEQLHDLATEAYFQYAIAEVEMQRANVLRDSAERQLGVHSAELSRRANAAQRVHTGLGLRRGLTYYAAERLREEFDLFDRSFAMWNSGLASRGAISAQIQLDPTNTRYALDSDIHLFDWLNRERESTRADPDTLRVHWRQMLRLAKDVCTKRGCKPGDGNLGQIGATGDISARAELVTAEEWKRFQAWQKNPSGRFIMQFSILPGNRLVPLQYENIRIVDLRLAGAFGGKRSILTQIALRHSGVAQIPRADKGSAGGLVFQREALLPRQSTLFNKPRDFNVSQLRNRYNGDFNETNYPTPGDFEGYGLYAMYQLTFEDTKENRQLDDVILKVAYFYNDATNIVSEEQYLHSLRAPDSVLPFEIHDYRLTSKASASCAGQPGGDAVEVSVANIPPQMRPSFSTAFARASGAQGDGALAHLSEANRARLQALQACLETKVEIVCKPMGEIRRIAASWAAAYAVPPADQKESIIDTQSPADDSKVPRAIRDRYVALCQKG